LDFDKTITVADSTDVVVAACREYRAKLGKESLARFDAEVDRIFTDYTKQYEKLMAEFHSIITETSSFAHLRAALNAFFEKEKAMEVSSAQEISQLNLLGGHTRRNGIG